jgi:hypothetical protein
MSIALPVSVQSRDGGFLMETNMDVDHVGDQDAMEPQV